MHIVKKASKEFAYQLDFIENNILICMSFTRKVQADILINCWSSTIISGKSNASHRLLASTYYLSFISAKWEPSFMEYIRKLKSSLSRRNEPAYK